MLRFSEVALLQNGPTLSLEIKPGQTLCILGPSGSGKTRLSGVVGGDQPDRGEVERPPKIAIPKPANRKLRPQDLSHRKGTDQAAIATDVLSQLGLWDVRQQEIAGLAAGQIAACDLVGPFLSRADLLVFDESLDALDPWATAGAMRLIRGQCAKGAMAVVVTNRIAWVTEFDFVVVMKDHQPIFGGSVRDLVATRGQRSLTITSERNPGVRALLDPLPVTMERTDSGVKLTPGPGQNHTAKLLRDGYGDIRAVITDQRSATEIVLEMITHS